MHSVHSILKYSGVDAYVHGWTCARTRVQWCVCVYVHVTLIKCMCVYICMSVCMHATKHQTLCVNQGSWILGVFYWQLQIRNTMKLLRVLSVSLCLDCVVTCCDLCCWTETICPPVQSPILFKLSIVFEVHLAFCAQLVLLDIGNKSICPPVQSPAPTPTPFACNNQDCVSGCGGYCDAHFGCICPTSICAARGYGSCNWYNSGSQFCQCPGGVACGKYSFNAGQCQNTPLMTSALVKAPASA